MRSVARPDDGVHSFFAQRSDQIVGNLLEPQWLEKGAAAFRPARKPRRFTLPAMLWLGIFGAAHAEETQLSALRPSPGCRAPLPGTHARDVQAPARPQAGTARRPLRDRAGPLLGRADPHRRPTGPPLRAKHAEAACPVSPEETASLEKQETCSSTHRHWFAACGR